MTAPHIVCPHCNTVNRTPIERLAEANCGKCKAKLFVGEPATLNSESFNRQISRSEIPVLVDFWAPWCGPCLSMAPSFKTAASQLEPHIRLAKVDTETFPVLASHFHIRSIPTLILFMNGKEVARQSGAMDTASIKQWVQPYLG